MAFVYDTSAQTASLSTGDPVTLAYTCGTNCKLLVLAVLGQTNAGRTGGAPTYNSVAMTQANSSMLGEAECTTEIWYLRTPDTGSSYDISVPNTGGLSIRLVAVSFTLATGSSALFNVSSTNTTGADPSLTINSVPDGAACVEALGSGYKDAVGGRTHTQLFDNDEGAWNDATQYTIKSGAGNLTMSFTQSSDDVAMVMVAFTTATDATVTPTVLTASFTLNAPTVALGYTAATTALSLTTTVQAPLIPQDQTVTASALSLSASIGTIFIAGSIFTVQTGVSTFASGTNQARKLARASNGDLHCVYMASDGSYDQVYYSKSTDNGETWSQTQLTSDSYNQELPSLCIDSNDYLHVTWCGLYAGSPTIIQLRYVKSVTQGASWGDIENLTSESYNQFTAPPSIAVDSGNVVHIVWTGQHDGRPTIHQVRYIKNNGSWSGITNITDEALIQREPALAIDSNDYLHVSWKGTGLVYRRFTSSWQTPVTIYNPGYTQQIPCIAIDSSDNVHVVWFGQDATHPAYYVVFYCVSLNNGVSFESVETLVTESGESQQQPTIVIDGTDKLHVLWWGQHSGQPTYNQIRYKYKDGGSWSSIINLTDDSSEANDYCNAAWALHPTIGGSKPGLPVSGFAFIWVDGTTLKYYRSSDLTWDIVVSPASFSLALSLNAPTIETTGAVVIEPTALSLSLALGTPTELFDFAVVTTAQSSTLSLQSPTVSVGVSISVTALSLSTTLDSATVSIDCTNIATAQALSISLQTPTEVSDVTVSATAQTLSLSLQAPLVFSGTSLSVTALSISATLQAPSVQVDYTYTDTAQALSLTLGTPTIQAGGSVTVTATAISMSIALQATTEVIDFTVVETVLSLSSTLNAPAILVDYTLSSSAFNLSTTLNASAELIDSSISITVLSLSITAGTPTAMSSYTAVVTAETLSLSLGSPSYTTSYSFTATAEALSLSLGTPVVLFDWTELLNDIGLTTSLVEPAFVGQPVLAETIYPDVATLSLSLNEQVRELAIYGKCNLKSIIHPYRNLHSNIPLEV